MKIVFFTGAGISRESGLATFRDEDGLWKKYDPQVVCSSKGYNKDKKAVLDFHNKVRAEIDKVQPNAAHVAIAALEEKHDVTVITQNIDNLHERAGSTKVIKIHGDIYSAQLKRYKSPTIPWSEDITSESYPEGWERSKGTLRHNVVLFGESPQHLNKAWKEIEAADLLIVVGTSLEVQPAASLVQDARMTKRVLINYEGTIHDNIFNEVILGKATEEVPKYCAELLQQEGDEVHEKIEDLLEENRKFLNQEDDNDKM